MWACSVVTSQEVQCQIWKMETLLIFIQHCVVVFWARGSLETAYLHKLPKIWLHGAGWKLAVFPLNAWKWGSWKSKMVMATRQNILNMSNKNDVGNSGKRVIILFTINHNHDIYLKYLMEKHWASGSSWPEQNDKNRWCTVSLTC